MPQADRGVVERIRRVDTGGIAPLVAAIALLLVIGAASTSDFATGGNFRAILTSASITGIAAVGMTFLTLAGSYFSLGVQQTAAMAELLFLAVVRGQESVPLAILVTLAVVVAIGVIQGIVVALGLNTIITTLAVGSVIFGVISSATHGRTLNAGSHSLGWLGDTLIAGVPPAVWVFVVITAVATAISQRTTAGRRITLLGANRATARLSGIRLLPTTVVAFGLMSVGIAIAGIMSAAQLQQATANDLSSLTTDVTAAVLVGGTSIAGGYGSPLRSALGAITIAILNNLMVLNGFAMGWRLGIEGALVVAVVSVLHVTSGRRR